MKMIFNIAKTELKTLFCSPVAWLVLVVFIFQADTEFCSAYLSSLIMCAGNGMKMSATQYVYVRGVIGTMCEQLYFYIPLLTMGVMSRELKSGSIKLLYSSPVTDRQIIFGKFLGLVIYFILMLIIIVLQCIFGYYTIVDLQMGVLWSGVLALFLLVCCYGAIGLFISSMTSYQIVAAVGTFAILAILSLISGVGQGAEWSRNLIHWLCMSGKSGDMISGLIQLEDIVYYIVIIGLFISFSILRLILRRKRLMWWQSAMRYVVVAVIFLAVGFLFSRPKLNVAFDMTSTKSFSLHEESKAILDQIKEPITITTYVNVLDQNFISPMGQFGYQNVYRAYSIYRPDIKFKFIYYYDKSSRMISMRGVNTKKISIDSLAIKRIAALNLNEEKILTPEKMKEIRDLSDEEYRFVTEISIGDGAPEKRAFLRIFDDMTRYPSEAEITGALKKISIQNRPYVAMLTGHDERSAIKDGDFSYKNFLTKKPNRSAMINQGYTIEELALTEGGSIDSKYNLLIIADVREPLKDWELKQIEDFIAAGGNMIITAEARRVEFTNPLIEALGLHFADGMLMQPGEKHPANLIRCFATEQLTTLDDRLATYRHNNPKYRKYFFAEKSSYIERVGESRLGNFEYIPLFTPENAGAWAEKENFDIDAAQPVFNPKAGEVMPNDPVILTLLRREVNGKQQNIFVCASANAFSDAEAQKYRGYTKVNPSFVLVPFKWFSNGEFPVFIQQAPMTDIKYNISQKTFNKISPVLRIYLPILLALIGIIYLRLRHREIKIK